MGCRGRRLRTSWQSYGRGRDGGGGAERAAAALIVRLGPSPLQANTRKKAVLDFSGFAFAEDQKASRCSACQANSRL
jgi:hypothetical protein